MEKLFSLASFLKNIQIILIQIDEAHSTEWPMSIDTLLSVDRVEPQKTFEDRLKRADYFINKYKPPYPVYVDTWSNEFAEKYSAWPDKYHIFNKDLKIVAKSEYHLEGEKEAVIIEDCIPVLIKLQNDCLTSKSI